MSHPTAAEIQNAIRNVPDFPKPGIQFKDITPVLADARLFAGAIDLLTEKFQPGSVDTVVGIDARGFIFAAAAAVKLQAGFVPVRKKGKLPYQTIEQDYALEYGSATVAIHIAHRVGAALAACALLGVAVVALRERVPLRLVLPVIALLLLQSGLGALAVAGSLPLAVVLAHSTVATLLLLALLRLDYALHPAAAEPRACAAPAPW